MTHTQLHTKALGLAVEFRKKEAELLDVLIQMQKQSAFHSLGYTGVFDFCFTGLKLSESQSFYFQRVTRKAIEVPQLKAFIDEGKVSLSQARRIEPVLTKDNCKLWVEKATKLPQKELERQVQKANPRALPIKERPVEKTLRRLMELLSKSREDVIEMALEQLADRVDPERKADRAVLSLRKTSVKVQPAGKRLPIPAHVKHQVVLDQGYRCAKCKTSRHLHWHHIKPVSEGGANTPENLTLLCWAHHQIHHRAQSARLLT